MSQRMGVLGKRLGFAALCFVLLLIGLVQQAFTPQHAMASTYTPDFYQSQNNGKIWQYDGGGFHSWSLLDTNPASVYLIARGVHFYQVHTDHTLWQYDGGGLYSWSELDNNPAISEVAAGNSSLYQMHTTGSVWQYDGGGFHSWSELDDNPATTWITAGGNQLYQLHSDGSVWQYNGGGFHSWTQIDHNPYGAGLAVSDTGLLYESRNRKNSSGQFQTVVILRYAGGGNWTR